MAYRVGERARLSLARLLLTTANVLVLDEPTNDLDVMTLGALEELLLEFSGAALLVSHDRYFLDRVATSVLVLDGLGGTTHVQGGYSSYERWRALARKNRDKEAVRAQPTKGQAPQVAPKPKKLTYAERLEYDKLMPRIEALGLELEQLESALSDSNALHGAALRGCEPRTPYERIARPSSTRSKRGGSSSRNG